MRFSSWIPAPGPTEAEVRAEIWRLGGRYRGEPLRGALDELKGVDLTAERTRLLQACIRRLRAN